MLINTIRLLSSQKTVNGYKADVELEAEDGFAMSGAIDFTPIFGATDYQWTYDLGFLSNFVTTDEDKVFVHGVLTSDDFISDVRTNADRV